MSVHAYSPFAHILAQAMTSFEQFVLKKYSCRFGLTKGKNIVTNICKNICSFSAFFHWHFPPNSVTAQSSKSVCHWASGERKQTLCSVDQKTPIRFDASLAVCLILSLESQPHPKLLATRAKQSQTLSPTEAGKPLLPLGFLLPGLFCWHKSTAGIAFWGLKHEGFSRLVPLLCSAQGTAAPAGLPGAAQHHLTHGREQGNSLSHTAAQGELESPGWGCLERFSSVGCAECRIFC